MRTSRKEQPRDVSVNQTEVPLLYFLQPPVYFRSALTLRVPVGAAGAAVPSRREGKSFYDVLIKSVRSLFIVEVSWYNATHAVANQDNLKGTGAKGIDPCIDIESLSS